MALSKRAVIVGCVAVAAVVVGVNVVKVVAREPDHPSAWDPRAADLVGFVERERGLGFEHSVEVRFLPEADFRGEVTSEEADLSDEGDAEFTRQEAAARAFGLLGPDDDLFEQVNTVTGEGILAYYSPEDTEIDPAQALAAADGWDGDVFVAYEEHRQGCGRLDMVGTDAPATDRVETAFEAWAGDRDGFEEVRRTGEIVSVKACDPGGQAVSAGDDEVALPFVRAALLREFVSQGMPVPVAFCAASDVTSNVELDLLLADQLDEDQLTTLQDVVGEMVGACAESAD
jgi:hypothetical protein